MPKPIHIRRSDSFLCFRAELVANWRGAAWAFSIKLPPNALRKKNRATDKKWDLRLKVPFLIG